MGRRGCSGQRGKRGGEWDNCNSIINKIYVKNTVLSYELVMTIVKKS